jgi:hypothetical protein
VSELNFLKRKELLFSPKTPEKEWISWGDHYLEAGRLHDAAAFYGRAKYGEGLAEIRRRAVEQGNVMLFREALKGMDETEADPGEWRQLAQHAESRGRWRDALAVYERLSDAVGTKRAQKALQSLCLSEGDEKSADEGGETPHGG